MTSKTNRISVPSSKGLRLAALAKKRREDESYSGYCKIGSFHEGKYDCDYVSPYTKSASNVDADYFLLLQDWSSKSLLEKEPASEIVIEWGHDPTLPTNINLKGLLCANLGLCLSDVYATNLFPFIKGGGASSRIPTSDLNRAAKEYALPQIAIVRPKIVVCFGLTTANAIRNAIDSSLPPYKKISTAIGEYFTWEGIHFSVQAHPGYFGQMNRNRVKPDKGGLQQDSNLPKPSRVSKDWAKMKNLLTGENQTRSSLLCDI